MTLDTKPNDAAYRRKFLIVQAITVVRIPLSIGFAVLLLCAERSTGVLLGGLAILMLCELTDFLDGTIARRTGVRSEWGAMLDPYADSVTRMIVFWALACSGLALAIVPLTLAVRDITVAYSRIVLTKHGKSVAANWSGKAKAVIQAGGSWCLLVGPIYWKWTGEWPIATLSLIVVAATLASAVQYVRSACAAASTANGDDA